MARFFGMDEIEPSLLSEGLVAVVGYGNQGRAHALNLRDSGVQVAVGARTGKGHDAATVDGFEVCPISEAVTGASIVMLTLPDLAMPQVFEDEVLPHLSTGQCLVFAHGFAIRYGLVRPPAGLDVVLVAPKGAGAKLRSEYEQGRGLAAFVAVQQDATGKALSRALSYAWGLGCARSLILETTFAEETEADLFGEQVVLCGGIPELIKAAYDQLVSSGCRPEVAYFECLHEVKLIADLIYDRGIAGMRSATSDIARWGGLTVGPSIVGTEARRAMEEALARIRSGDFARECIGEAADEGARLQRLEADEAGHSSETVGDELRRKMGL